MELHISENNNTTSSSYAPMTYDDILNVLTQGVSNQSWYSAPQPQPQQQQQQNQQQLQQNNKKVKYDVSPDLDPNSKIMQKYFTNKNQNQNQNQGSKTAQYLYFKTKEEYQRYVFQEKMRNLREKKRLEEIKPKKMAFLSEGTSRFSSNVSPMFSLTRLPKK